MRLALLTTIFTLCAAGAAMASDFIVVRSTDPRIVKSMAFEAGERVMLAPGAAMTLITGTGEVLTFAGVAGGVTLPKIETADASRFSALMALISRPPKRRTFGAVRSMRNCAPAAELTTLDAILEAEEAGCQANATAALEAYLAANATTGEEPAPEETPAAQTGTTPVTTP